jgi:plasmid stabilization system protein ParE
MVKKIIWTPEAIASNDAVVDYLQENWTSKEIRKYFEKLNAVIKHISLYPEAFRLSGKEDVREALITKNNLLLYRVAGNTLFLLYFWDTRKNPFNKP